MVQTLHKNEVQASVKSVKRGRPQLYDAARLPRIANILCKEHGFTLKQLARVFNVALITVKTWMQKHAEFYAAVKSGRDFFDSEVVERTLLKRATGYEYEEVQIKNGFDKNGNPTTETTTFTRYEPPNFVAIRFFLCNRDPGRYSVKSCQ